MIDKTEAERIAEAVHALRPDWVASSIVRLIGENADLRSRAYRDLAVAFAYVACDSATLTPGRVREAGPWWAHTNAQKATTSAVTTRCPEHPAHAAWDCPECADAACDPDRARELAAAARAAIPRRQVSHRHPEPAPTNLADVRAKADRSQP